MTATHWYLLGLASGALIALVAVALIVGVLWSDLKLLWRHQHR